MVSEAVSSGRPVLVFMPDKKSSKITKYEKFVRGLEKKGYIKLVSPEDLASVAINLIKTEKAASVPDDDNRIFEKMYKLF